MWRRLFIVCWGGEIDAKSLDTIIDGSKTSKWAHRYAVHVSIAVSLHSGAHIPKGNLATTMKFLLCIVDLGAPPDDRYNHIYFPITIWTNIKNENALHPVCNSQTTAFYWPTKPKQTSLNCKSRPGIKKKTTSEWTAPADMQFQLTVWACRAS